LPASASQRKKGFNTPKPFPRPRDFDADHATLWLSGRNFGTGSATDAITQSDTTVAETPISVKLARIDDTWIFGSLARAAPYFLFTPAETQDTELSSWPSRKSAKVRL